MDVSHYQYIVSWDSDDEIFVARVTEFPSLAAHGDTAEEALSEIQIVVGDVVDDLRRSGEAIPAPLSERKFSGRFNVRVPPALHRSLVTQAAEQQVSLNQLITMKLARP